MNRHPNTVDVTNCPEAARPVLARYFAGDISAEIAIMQLLLALGGMPALVKCVAALPDHTLRQLVERDEAALAGASALVEQGLTRERAGDIAAIREQFDRAVRICPEAAVALYSLGAADTLARATAELVARLEEWHLLGPQVTVLDIGCGIGRLEAALAPRVRAITGIDVSPAMIAEATSRCAGLANVDLSVCNGTGLGAFLHRQFDLIVAVDAFPYLVAADPALAAHHIADAAQLLPHGGVLLILNYSYRSDLASDRWDIAALAQRFGFLLEQNGTREFMMWDGATFLLRKRS